MKLAQAASTGIETNIVSRDIIVPSCSGMRRTWAPQFAFAPQTERGAVVELRENKAARSHQGGNVPTTTGTIL